MKFPAHKKKISVCETDVERVDVSLFRINHWSEYSSHKAYADSKLMIVASSYKLNGQLRDENTYVSVSALHPGVVQSDLWKNVTVWIHRIPLKLIKKLFLVSFVSI